MKLWMLLGTRFKNKIENNSTCEGAFYQSEWVKFNSRWLILVFSLHVLKTQIENNSTWEGAFYQNDWVKINSSWIILVFFLL